MKDQTDYRPILEFWFDELEPGDWFKGGEQVDRGDERAAAGDLLRRVARVDPREAVELASR